MSPLVSPTDSADALRQPFVDEARLLRSVAGYLSAPESDYIAHVLDYAHQLLASPHEGEAAGGHGSVSAPGASRAQRSAVPVSAVLERPDPRSRWDFAYVIAVAQALADTVHVDAVSLGAVLLYQGVELGIVSPAEIRQRLGGQFGDETARLIESIERFDALQRPAAARRRAADRAGSGDHDGARARRRERHQHDEAEAVRKMFIGMAEDPRVVIFKITDYLRTMRAARAAADELRARAGATTSRARATPDADVGEGSAEVDEAVAKSPSPDGPMPGALAEEPAAVGPEQRWTLEECLASAREARTLYAPLAGRLGMGRLEGELEDLAFAVLEPDEYHWLSEAVAEEKHQRSSYVSRVCGILRDEMARLGVRADVSGRVKHLYSIYRKVERTGSRDISQLFDIVAFRIIVDSVADCYLALGHVHQLWRPKDGRIKDFIASPKPNGYQSLHTTVFCLDDRLAEIQIRTREQHQVAEYGVAMHWHYKEAGDSASASAAELQAWINQVVEWQQDFQQQLPGPAAPVPPLRSEDHIYVFTPAGDPKELPAGSTPLDFAYRIHSDVGNHCSGARVTTDDGQLVTRMVPLDYELKNGDTVEIITQKSAHPTRDWLRVARTKGAKTHILKYLKAHERHIDLQIGKDRLDHELKLAGVRTGINDLRDDDLLAVARELGQPDIESLLVAFGIEKLRATVVVGKLRERIPAHFPPPSETHEDQDTAAELPRGAEAPAAGGVDVAGVGGLYTRLASCCSPVPGDEVRGFITRGRGVVVHRADCPNLAAMVAAGPERAVAVSLSDLDGTQTYHVPIVVQAMDRQGLLADVTGVITRLKINMAKVTTITQPTQHTATITAILELNRAEQLDTVVRQVLGVKSVLSVERKRAGQSTARAASRTRSKHHS